MTGEEDAALTRELELRLRRDGAYDMNTAHRRKALRILRRVVRDWMRHIWRSQSSAGRLSSSPVPEATVLTFGSCEMRVNAPDADVDCLLLAPRGCDRARDFFGTLVATLRERGDVDRLIPIPNIFAPVVKFAFEASISTSSSPASPASPPFHRTPPACTATTATTRSSPRSTAPIPSANGAFEASTDVAGPPSRSRLRPDPDAFRLALRFVKRWAKTRGVYGNVFGLLGGASWAVLTARACQLHPNESAAHGFRFFPRLLGMAVARTRAPGPPGRRPVGRGLESRRKRRRRRRRRMGSASSSARRRAPHAGDCPDVAPTRHRVQRHRRAFAVIRAELARGDRAFERHWFTSNAHPSCVWDELLRSPRFFQEHRHFLAVDTVSAPEVASEHHAWGGWVESRLRWLVLAVERASGGRAPRAPVAAPARARRSQGNANREVRRLALGR